MKELKFCCALLVLLLASVGMNAQTIGGIGAVLKLDTAKDGSTLPLIQSLANNSPAARALQPGLFIISVDGKPCRNKPLEEIIANIRGTAGTRVKVVVADNTKGKQPKEHELERVLIQQVAPPEPAEAFVAECEKRVKMLRREGRTIAKATSSDCGDFFFNFDTEPGNYYVEVWALDGGGDAAVSSKVYDNNNEQQTSIALKRATNKSAGNLSMTSYEAAIAFTRETVGVISIKINGPATNSCKAVYVIAHK